MYLQDSGVCEELGLQKEGQVLHNLRQLAVDSLYISAGTVTTTMTPLLPRKTTAICTITYMYMYTTGADCLWTLTFGASPVDGVKLRVDVVLEVESGDREELLQALLLVNVLGHIGSCVDVENSQCCIHGAQHPLSGSLSPGTCIPSTIILYMKGWCTKMGQKALPLCLAYSHWCNVHMQFCAVQDMLVHNTYHPH